MPRKMKLPNSVTHSAWWLSCLLATAHVHAADEISATVTPAYAARNQTYSITNLGSGTLMRRPVINSSGQVAFTLNLGESTNGWFYDGNNTKNVGINGSPETYVADLNDAGQVVGSSAYQPFFGASAQA